MTPRWLLCWLHGKERGNKIVCKTKTIRRMLRLFRAWHCTTLSDSSWQHYWECHNPRDFTSRLFKSHCVDRFSEVHYFFQYKWLSLFCHWVVREHNFLDLERKLFPKVYMHLLYFKTEINIGLALFEGNFQYGSNSTGIKMKLYRKLICEKIVLLANNVKVKMRCNIFSP